MTSNLENAVKEDPRISVVTCAYTMDRFDDTLQVVQSVLDQTVPPHEVIVSIDKNKELFQNLQQAISTHYSPDNSQIAASQDSIPPVKVILNTGDQGVSETRSQGIREAGGNLVACIDDDAVAEQNWLEEMVRALNTSNASVVGGKCILSWPNGNRPIWFAEELDWVVGGTYKGMPTNGNVVRNVATCSMIAPKSVYEQAGFFSKEIGAVEGGRRGGEEAEFCLRVKERIPGKDIVYEPNAVVHHKVHAFRVSLKYLVRRSYDEGYSKAIMQKCLKTSGQLSTENSYLRYLLCKSIPNRIKNFHKKESFIQLGAIAVSTIATVAGYAVGKLQTSKGV